MTLNQTLSRHNIFTVLLVFLRAHIVTVILANETTVITTGKQKQLKAASMQSLLEAVPMLPEECLLSLPQYHSMTCGYTVIY